MIPEQKEENVEASILSYLKANYSLTPIEWPRTVFAEGASADFWIQPTVVFASGEYRRQVAQGRKGARLHVLLNINIFGKRNAVEKGDPYKMILIRDTLKDLFWEGTNIPAKDYATDPADPSAYGIIGCYNLQSNKLPKDEFYGENLTIEMLYQEEHAA